MTPMRGSLPRPTRRPPGARPAAAGLPAGVWPPHAFGGALRALALVGPPVTVATALLFYFGWALTAAQSRAMGVDESIFAMSTRDYVLRSLSALFVPVVVGSSTLLLWVVVHGWLLDLLARRGPIATVRRAGRVMSWTAWWLVPSAAAALAVPRPEWGGLLIPLSIALGFLLSEYGSRVQTLAGPRVSGPAVRPPWVARLRSVLIGVLVTSALFWEVANFAGVVGRGKAELVATSINDYPAVKVYAQHNLNVEVAGVEALVFDGENGDFRFVYSGLRLVQRTGDRFFLVPPDWTQDSQPLVVLRDDASVRVEFTGS